MASVSKRPGRAKVSTTADIYTHLPAEANKSACDALDKVIYSSVSESE